MTEPYELTATEASMQMDADELTAETLVESCIERIEARESVWRAWKHFEADAARTQAKSLDRGPRKGGLHGIPFGVKDIIDTAKIHKRHLSQI